MLNAQNTPSKLDFQLEYLYRALNCSIIVSAASQIEMATD